MGPQLARQTTVVFDASVHPGDFSLNTQYRGLGILFALGDENADARIEQLIAADSNPKTLAVVSSDRRIRQAAVRRKTKSVTADQFWELIDDLDERRRSKPKLEAPPRPNPHGGEEHSAADDTAYCSRPSEQSTSCRDFTMPSSPTTPRLTDAEIAEIEREVQREL